MPHALQETIRRQPREGTSADRGEADDFEPILRYVFARTRHDFRGYRTGMIHRRVRRRMQLQRQDNVVSYLDFLRRDPDELHRLRNDLLILTTAFFRDAEAFDELARTVLADLVARGDHDPPIRIWVAGCSTGEEAYTIAILLAEEAAKVQTRPQVQIFATDAAERALDVARAGIYAAKIAASVTPERLRRFFRRTDDGYKIASTIREWIVFAKHDVLRDPPYSQLDLVSCRNLLIYLVPEVQRSVLARFHFALKPEGYLFLGRTESIRGWTNHFSPICEPARIYRRAGSVHDGPRR